MLRGRLGHVYGAQMQPPVGHAEHKTHSNWRAMRAVQSTSIHIQCQIMT